MLTFYITLICKYLYWYDQFNVVVSIYFFYMSEISTKINHTCVLCPLFCICRIVNKKKIKIGV